MQDSHAALTAFVNEFLPAYYDFWPTNASQLGLHEYDGRPPDLSQTAIERRVSDLGAFQARLAAIDPHSLDKLAWLDYQLLRQQIEFELFQWQEWRLWQRDPTFYVWFLDISGYLKRNYAPLETRARAIVAHLSAAPQVLQAARSNLTNEATHPVIQVALGLFKGLIDFMRADLPLALADLPSARRDQVMAAADQAIEQVTAFVDWLEQDLFPRAGADFAIGRAAFLKLLRVGEAVEIDLAHLAAVGEQNLAENKAAYLATAKRLAPDGDVARVIAETALDYPPPENLIAETRRMVQELRAWVVERDLVSVPYDEQCRVAETPRFLRWAFAMMDPAGPFESQATESFYYITPPLADWPALRIQEWMAAFNYPLLRNTSAHETWPGHYLNGLHERNSPSRVTRSFGAYSFYEAWAHYCEQMLIEQGYQAGDDRYLLAQLADALTRNVRYVCAIGLHTQGMTLEQAKQRFMQDAFMSEATAHEEALRGTYDPGYLNYTLGKLMLLKLRQDYQAEQKSNFSLKAFHDAVLAYGAPQLPLLRHLILQRDDGQIL